MSRGFVRGIYREGSYTEDSDRQVTEGSGNGTFLEGGGFGQYVYWAGTYASYIFRSCITSRVCGLIFDHNTLRDFSLGSGKLNPKVIRKIYPRPVLAFSKVVREGQGIRGHNGPAC